jgi:hypothetical protein
MKDYLKDLIDHTYGLGCIELIKVTGTDTETQINAMSEDRSVIVSGTFATPIAEFVGVFGMPNLSKLKTIISFDEYSTDAQINMVTTKINDVEVPSTIHFETKDKSFVNDYRLMSQTIVEEKVRAVSFKGATWNVEFEPSISGIQRLKKQATANSEERYFTTKTDGTDLKIYFGDPSTHSGNFVFQANISGTLSKSWMWPVKEFTNIMDLVGDKTVRITDAGATSITVDSGIATYTYLLPAQAK